MVTPPNVPPKFFVSVDLGQSNDFTAIAIIEKVFIPAQRPGEEEEKRASALDIVKRFGQRSSQQHKAKFEYHLRYLERPPLRTSYTKIARRVVKRATRLEPAYSGNSDTHKQRHSVVIAVDATGVGRGVVEMFRDEIRHLGDPQETPFVKLQKVQVTAGNKINAVDGFVNVPKMELIGAGTVTLQGGELRIPKDIAHRDTLIEELRNYRRTVTLAGNTVFDTWREKEHDDLLFAVCLGVWSARRTRMTGPLEMPKAQPRRSLSRG